MPASEDYLRQVHRYAEDALVQQGAVSRCKEHKDVLLHNPDYEGGPIPHNLVVIWMKQYEKTTPIREDVRDALQGILDEAAWDGCPECARTGDA